MHLRHWLRSSLSCFIMLAAGCLGGPRDSDDPKSAVAGESESLQLTRFCGGPRHLICTDSQYCRPIRADHCLGQNEYGVCATKNQVCSQLVDPACGCDGKTYPNACIAGQRGVVVAHQGACDGSACEGNGDCGASSFCQFPDGACDTEGSCRTRPEVCTDLFKPVCGCDGKTYSNACNANGAGESVATQGECPTTKPPFCGGIAGFPCPGAGKCVDDPSDSCDPNNGGADCGGICTCVETQLCVQGDHFNGDPSVCACVPN